MAVRDEIDEATEVAPPKKSKAKLFIILGVLVVLLGGGGAAAWFLMQGGDETAEEAEEKAPVGPPQFLAQETFTVNLQDSEQYLQIDITLQLPDIAQVDAIKQHMPRVRSRLLALLASKQAAELFTAEDKKRLADEIKAQVAQPFVASAKPQKVDDVLFTSFVIQ